MVIYTEQIFSIKYRHYIRMEVFVGNDLYAKPKDQIFYVANTRNIF